VGGGSPVIARTEFGLLGPLVVRCGGVLLPVRPGKQRAVLALLLLNAGQVVAFDEIADVLWGAAPPPSARVTVRNYVSRLRQAVEQAGPGRIGTTPRGYLISLGAGELDVARFEVLTASAQAAVRAGSWEPAAARARAALALWRGEPLADVGAEVLTAREVPRLAETRLLALEARIEADVQLGRQADVIAELQRLVAGHPLREHLRALLMLALYRCGRQAEALAAYQGARRVLIEELGAEPAAELRELHQRVLRGDAGLMTAPGPAASAGSGPAAGGSPPAFPGRPAPVPRQLPAAGPHFTGRAAEISALLRLAGETAGGTGPLPRRVRGEVPIVAIAGTAGVGKTALALHVAHLVADRFPDGQLYLDLRGFDPSAEPLPPAAAVRSFLDGLRVPPDQIPASQDAQAALYRSMLAGRRMLIVLDNAASAGQVRPLLPGAGHCLVVVTSRRQLTALTAREGACGVTLEVLTDREARELLAARLGPSRLAGDPAAAAELIAECARLPLALSVAAARAQARPQFPLGAVAAELRDARGRLDALDGGEASINVRAVLSWSYQQLTPAAARMFRLLGLHPGPDITLAAAASLAAVPPAHAARALARLTTTCLLTEHAPGRFAFHDLLRTYAAEQAAEDERQGAIRRLADHYLQSARAADQAMYATRPPIRMPEPEPATQPETFSGHVQALAWFDQEHQVLLAVVSLAAGQGLHVCAWQLPWAMETFLYRRAHWHDWASTQTIALAAAERIGDRDGQAHAHRGIANAHVETGSHDEGRRHFARALRLRESAGDLAGQARVHLDLARSAGLQHLYDDCLAHGRRGLELSRSARDLAGESNALVEVAWALALLGRHEQAIAYCHKALRLLRDFGHRAQEGHVWDTLGHAHRQLGHHAEAAASYQRAVQILDEYGYRYDMAVTLISAGHAYRAAGDPQAAGVAWRQALAILEETRHPDMAKVLADLSDLATPAGGASRQARLTAPGRQIQPSRPGRALWSG
jgi:DNA-binding SARP family transcriptional activator